MTTAPRSRLFLSSLVVLLVAAASPALARVVSYAPVTDRLAIPAQQKRTNRRFVLVETPPNTVATYGEPRRNHVFGRLVVFDSKGEEAPRTILPKDGTDAAFWAVAVREDDDGGLAILAVTAPRLSEGEDVLDESARYFLSVDSGQTFRPLELPTGVVRLRFALGPAVEDDGGPFARGKNSHIGIGTREVPFVVGEADESYAHYALHGVGADGGVRDLLRLAEPGTLDGGWFLLGSNREGSRFLVYGKPEGAEFGFYTVGLDGSRTQLAPLSLAPPWGLSAVGWITPNGNAYVTARVSVSDPPPPFATHEPMLLRVGNGRLESLAASADAYWRGTFFAVPSADYSEAWLVTRSKGLPTVLLHHDDLHGLTEAFRDPAAPLVEAVHAGASGRLLIQVYRPRALPVDLGPVSVASMPDPALAIWEPGQPAPDAYDELYLAEGWAKGFVHLDVDAVANGEPFVFDGSVQVKWIGMDGPSGAGGGGDVTQEWGIVKASLRQNLVLPAVAHVAGLGGSFWRTDVIVRNPAERAADVTLRYVPTGPGTDLLRETTLTLAPREIRLLEDVVATTFSVVSGWGALYVLPKLGDSVAVTGRTYTSGTAGTYGTEVPAFDLYAAASPRFPQSFAAAFPGPGFRTNLAVANVSRFDAELSLDLLGNQAVATSRKASMRAPTNGQNQLNGLESVFGLNPQSDAALALAPSRGEVVPLLTAIDARTNDPTCVTPDPSSAIARFIPAVVHASGLGGVEYRTDLHLYNPSDETLTVQLDLTSWRRGEPEDHRTVVLEPGRSRRVTDVLKTLFQRDGVARLRFLTTGARYAADTVRVTSRVYAVTPDGGTYGTLMPPINLFGMATEGESLEILGPRAASTFRTNLAFVELSATGGTAPPTVEIDVEIVDSRGEVRDRLTTTVPRAGGTQIDDLFRSRGLGDDFGPVLIRVKPRSGLVTAYATMLDRGTNDPVLFGPALGAK